MKQGKIYTDIMENVTNPSPNTKSRNWIFIIIAIGVVCLALICCLSIVIAILLLRPAWTERVVGPAPQIVPPVQVATVVPSLPSAEPFDQSTAGLDSAADPLYGSIDLMRAFTPDPYFIDAQAGGNIEASFRELKCGFTTSAPAFAFRLYGGASDTFLRIFYTASDGTDTTLIVYTPDQEWRCADDSSYGGLVDPVMDFEFGPSGKYIIWIGTKVSGTHTAGKLYITQSEYMAP